jgi:ankyrin repeat protein
MDARQPLDTNLGFYRKRAKDLKRAFSKREHNAGAAFVKHHPKFKGLSAAAVFDSAVSLADALLVIAREHGFNSWGGLKRAVEQAVVAPELAPSDALLAAVRAADLQRVRELIAQHPGLAALPGTNGALPLVEAADRGLADVALALLDAGADPTRGDPLLAAAHAGPHKHGPALAIVDLLIERGVANDIFVHALLGRTEAIRAELARADVNARGPANCTALFLAVWNGQVEAVRVLLEAGAEPNPMGRGERSAWEVAFQHAWSAPHRDVARLLLSHGVPCTLHEACVLSHLPTVKRLLAQAPELLERANDSGVTPVQVAILKADVELARLLLEAGAADPKGHARTLVANAPQQGKSFARSLFRDCSFEAVNFNDCSLKDVVLSNIDLSGATLDNVNLSGAKIDNAYIQGLSIYGIEVAPLLVRELERRAARKKTSR